MVRIEPPNLVICWLFGNTNYIVPYPAGHYRDTTSFYRYYARWATNREADTVVVSGRIREDISVGDPGLTQCEAVPYFEVRNIYSRRGKLLKHFPEPGK